MQKIKLNIIKSKRIFEKIFLRIEKKILHLILLRKWFIEILEGRKVEEYRDIKPYWTKRLFDVEGLLKIMMLLFLEMVMLKMLLK